MRLKTWLLAPLALNLTLLASLVSANTHIVQFTRPLCSQHNPVAEEAADHLSRSWPLLTTSTRPSLFTLWPPAQPKEAEYWLKVRFENDGHAREEGLLAALTRSLRDSTSRYVLRASSPANHPLDLEMTIHIAEEMLRAGEVDIETSDQPPSSSSSSYVKPCVTAYLHVKASRGKAVSIPPRGTSVPPSSWLTNLVERFYLGPLTSQQPKESTAAPTPIHLSLDPLLAGVAPYSLTVGSPLFVPLLLVLVLLAGPALARRLDAAISDILDTRAGKAHEKRD